MQRPYREIGKPFATRTVELVRALQLIRDALLHLRAGHVRHLASLSGQLRALLTDRSAKTEPLLLSVAETLGIPLHVYCMPDVSDPSVPPELNNDLVLEVSGFPITFFRQFRLQVKLSLPDMLDREIIFFKGNRYTARTLIDWYANKAGGAHYATRVPDDFAALLSEGAFAAQPLANVLLQLGEATLEAGRRVIKEVVDLEIHAVLVVPSQPDCNISDMNFLFDAQYEGSSMRLSLLLNKRLMPTFYAQGLQGIGLQVDANRLIDWSAPRYLHASLRIDDDLSTVMEIAVDGERVGRSRIDEPLFVLSDPLNYESFHNRAFNGQPQQFSFGVAAVSMYGCELDPASAANMLLYSLEQGADLDHPALLYEPGAFGHAPKGTKNLQMTGTVKRQPMSDILGQKRLS